MSNWNFVLSKQFDNFETWCSIVLSFSDGIVIYIRFIQVKALVDSLSKTKTVLRRLNIAAFVAGMISTFGISVLGNFQVDFKSLR